MALRHRELHASNDDDIIKINLDVNYRIVLTGCCREVYFIIHTLLITVLR